MRTSHLEASKTVGRTTTLLLRLMLVAAVISVVLSAYAKPKSKLVQVGEGRVKDEYIVILEDDVSREQVPEAARDLATEHGAKVEKVWRDTVKGFFARMPEARAEALSRNPRVKYVEENREWHLSSSQQTNVNPVTCNPTTGTCSTVPDNRLWHLDRVDQNYAPSTNEFRYCTDGTGETVYVVDTGVMKFHQEFGPAGARVQAGYNSTGDMMPANDPCMGFAIPPDDTYPLIEGSLYRAEWQGGGHGTAVASVLGGTRIGIAKNVTIVPIKTSRCDKFSARSRLASHVYQQNETIFRSTNGFSISNVYRALNSGTSAGSDPGGWPTTVGATIVDGAVTWQVIDVSTVQTTQMIVDGVNWILSPSNTGPKSYAVVTFSTYAMANDASALEDAVDSLLANNMTVIASANNQNGNACDTSPARMSIADPNAPVITVGGSMIINRPWSVDLSDVPSATEANGGNKGVEPAYVSTVAVRDGRWICGAGDSSTCSNTTSVATANPAFLNYSGFQGGSNAGPCVTLFAPAKNIFVASTTSANGYRDARISGGHATGTSWSAPIVAGYAARLLQNNNYTPLQMRNAMLANSVSTLDADTLNTYDFNGVEITGTPNKLLRLGDVNITDQPDSIATSAATPLTVVASGTSTLTYQWYKVNSGFDYTSYSYGAHSSTAIGGANGSTYQAPAPVSEEAYWVRVTGACGSADSNIAVVTPLSISAPTNVVATASVANVANVEITWTPVSGVDGYKVERKISSGAWQQAQVVTGPSSSSATDTPSAPNGVVIYRVLAYIETTDSPSSNVDVAYAASFSNDPLTVPTGVRAEHVTELRRAVNTLRDIALHPPVYTSSEVDPNVLRTQPVDDAHFTTLMTNLNAARALLNLPPAGFGTPPAAPGGVYSTQLVDLRNGLK